jgi:hypothetical protein
MTINVTIFEVVSTGQEFQVPGDQEVSAIVSAYSANIPGLASMDSKVTVEGDTKRIVFSPRTGTKG